MPQSSYNNTSILKQETLPSIAPQLILRSFSSPNSQGMNEYPWELRKQQADYAPFLQKSEKIYEGPEYRGENPWGGESP
ncbi:hypothetical protein OnM2_029008 [Erysiphe neolycopersici]|uniref:Uncharacterized protein n=1 Tax=Erysiphe neolycopersici TaxID=212602 RepID=A0A420HZL2_9PEZI|nr:hypothetical protein OnM2_029008 [Erysiphe neolycopersici]